MRNELINPETIKQQNNLFDKKKMISAFSTGTINCLNHD